MTDPQLLVFPPGVASDPDVGTLHVPHVEAPRHWYLELKPAVDSALALLLLIALSPVIALAALLIKLTSRGPAFYTQTRVGLGGRLFTIYKLRTMVSDSEARTGAVWCKVGDPRITLLGGFLRATHIDEFPQLLNVLQGHMSLVGPRPERPEIVAYLETKVENYTSRLHLPPGISGLAQVHLPPDVDLHGVRRKLVCDLHYIERFSPWLDLRLMLCTAFLLVGIPLRWSRILLRIPDPLKSPGQ